MPQASDDLRKRIANRFGDIGTAGPERYLTDRGYALSPEWLWSKPGVGKDMREMTRDEFECLLFLCHEWDYGGIEVL